jgi:hypothetical protein
VGRALFCCSVLFLPDLFVFFVLCYSGVRFGVVWSSVEVLRWWVVVFGLLFATGGVGVGGAADLFLLWRWF